MPRRYKVAFVFSAVILISTIFIAKFLLVDSWILSEDLEIGIFIDNRTSETIGPFTISDSKNPPTILNIDKIESLSKVYVYYKMSQAWGENAIILIDNTGKKYPVIPYFEHPQRGRVDIRVECVTSEGLYGKKRNLVSSYFSFEWDSWGTPLCE